MRYGWRQLLDCWNTDDEESFESSGDIEEDEEEEIKLDTLNCELSDGPELYLWT